MFRQTSAKQVLEQSLQNMKSLQNLVDLLEEHSSKMVSSYDAMYPYESVEPTSLGHLPPTTTQAHGLSTSVSLLLAPGATLPASTARLDTVTPSSRRTSWWKRMQRRPSSS
jgi:hypothetical protein